MIGSKDSASRLLSRAEVAAIFHVSPSTVTRWAEAGKLPMVKTLGGHRRYEAAAVHALAGRLSLKPDIDNTIVSIEQEDSMAKTVIDVPAMYGDHHVLEVRRILLRLTGVQSVNASSCFQVVEIVFNPVQISAEEIRARLEAAGYLTPLPLPVETELAVTQLPEAERQSIFRHTTAAAQVQETVSFAHTVPQRHLEQGLWPCPGVGPRPSLKSAGGNKEEASHV